MPYSYEITDTIKTNLYKALKTERKIHLINKKTQYKPKIYFEGGVIECFSELKNIN